MEILISFFQELIRKEGRKWERGREGRRKEGKKKKRDERQKKTQRNRKREDAQWHMRENQLNIISHRGNVN